MNNQTYLLWSLLLFFPLFLQGQIIWGYQAPTGQAAGEFRDTFVQATSAGNYSNTHWTALSIHHDSGQVVPGAAFWTRTTTGKSQGAYYAPQNDSLESATVANGAAIFDSDFLDNGGGPLPIVFGTGTAPSSQRAELVSPLIDLTGLQDTALVLSLDVLHRFFRYQELSFSLSTDNGQTWQAPIKLSTYLPIIMNQYNQDRVRILLPNWTAGASNLSQCRLKFTFEGDYYFVIIDDLSLEIAPAYDLAIGVPDTAANELWKQGSYIRMGGNAHMNYYNVDFAQAKGWSWGAKVVNRGAQDMPPSLRPRLMCRVDWEDLDAWNTGFQTIFLDSIICTDTIFAQDWNGVFLEKDITTSDLSDLMGLRYGRQQYTVYYWVEQDGLEGSTWQDTIVYTFDYERDNFWPSNKAHISKARTWYWDNRVWAEDYINLPDTTLYRTFEYGSVFYFPNAVAYASNFVIDSIDFCYKIPYPYTGDTNCTLIASVYVYDDGGIANANGQIDGSKLTQIGVSLINLRNIGQPSGVPIGISGRATSGSFVNAATGGPMPYIDPYKFYYISVAVESGIFPTGSSPFFKQHDVPLFGVDKVNYAQNKAKAIPSTFPYIPATSRVVDSSYTTRWLPNYPPIGQVPAIGVHFSRRLYSATQQVSTSPIGQLKVHPNPVTDWLHVSATVEKDLPYQYIITNAVGQVVYYTGKSYTQASQLKVDVRHLATGVYRVSLRTEGGVLTEAFVKE